MSQHFKVNPSKIALNKISIRISAFSNLASWEKRRIHAWTYVQFRGFTKFGIKVAWSLQFLGYLRTLSLKFQKAGTKIGDFLPKFGFLGKKTYSRLDICTIVHILHNSFRYSWSKTKSNSQLLIKDAFLDCYQSFSTFSKRFFYATEYFFTYIYNAVLSRMLRIFLWYNIELVFCYHNCSDLLWKKNVLVIEKNFWNLRLMAKNLQKNWDH